MRELFLVLSFHVFCPHNNGKIYRLIHRQVFFHAFSVREVRTNLISSRFRVFLGGLKTSCKRVKHTVVISLEVK